MNQEEQIRQLLEKYERHACNEEEIRQLHEWLELKSLTGKPWEFRGPADRESVKNKMLNAISAGMESIELAGTTATYERTLTLRRSTVIPKWVRYAAVAAAVISVTWGILMLTRPAGEVIVVSSPGKIEKVNLPDGSTAWLNDNTALRYHRDFAANRSIELIRGEAFFDVKKDPDHIFTVRSRDLSTTVLGTSFSARMTGAAGDLKVSVVTGKVMINHRKDTLCYLLPGQRLKYDGTRDKIAIDTVLAGEADGWIHGDIFLQNASLREVVQWLQDHYKLNIQNKRTTYQGEYYLQAKSDIPLPEVLKILNLLGKKDHVKFSLQEQTLTIQ